MQNIILDFSDAPDFIFKEIWKPVVGYEELYSVSNYGRVKRKTKQIVSSDGKIRNVQGRILKNKINRDNYSYVGLSSNGKVKWFFNHTLVAKAFIPNPNNLPIVNHLDENPQNNYVENLEWTDHKGNAIHSIDKIYKSHENEKIRVVRIDLKLKKK